MTEPEHIASLREAVRVSPNNLPLRQALAEALLAASFFAEAVAEFRSALSLSPNSLSLKLGLARAFHADGRRNESLVVLEDLVQSPEAPGRAHVFYARLLHAAGEIEQAVNHYKLGVNRDPSSADVDFAQRLGIRMTEEETDDEVVDGRVRAPWDEPEIPAPKEVERPKITFADVGGMDALKEEIRLKIIYPLTHADMYKAYGKSAGGGILMYGPPGCGKTHLARATAGEIKASFISVGIHDVLEMWIGNSERNLHELFEQARQNAPCVLFFDEVDALGASRSDMKTSAGRHLINQFLSELDGIKSNNDGVLILGATNAPWHLDSAFRRPGRFDRILFVPPPDVPARAAILRLLLRGKPVEDVDCDGVARKCEGFSGADLKAVLDITIENKLREAMKSGVPSPIRTKDLLAAAGSQKPTTREWFSTAKNYALYSNQGGVYDDILNYLKLK